MDSPEKKILKALGDISKVDRLAGWYRGRDGQRALVDIGGGRIPADFCGYLPELNEPVWVEFLDGRALLLGPSQFKPDRGKFVSSNGGIAQVDTEIGSVAATFALGQAFAVNQVVKLMWQGGAHIVSVMSTQPALPPVPPSPSSGAQERLLEFRAIDSGSFRSGWWTNDVWYAQNNAPGAFFYGDQIKTTIPDNAEILGVWAFLRVKQASGSAPQIGTHPHAYKPGGGFSIGSKVTYPDVGAGFNDWLQLPNSVGDFLKANDGGIGTDGAGLRVFMGQAGDGQAGAIRIKARY